MFVLEVPLVEKVIRTVLVYTLLLVVISPRLWTRKNDAAGGGGVGRQHLVPGGAGRSR